MRGNFICFVNIGEIVGHHCLNFHFIAIASLKRFLFFEFFFLFTNIVYSTDLRQRIAKSSKHKGDFSTADTLRDTTDLVVSSQTCIKRS
jgi:hypothetical protein